LGINQGFLTDLLQKYDKNIEKILLNLKTVSNFNLTRFDGILFFFRSMTSRFLGKNHKSTELG